MKKLRLQILELAMIVLKLESNISVSLSNIFSTMIHCLSPAHWVCFPRVTVCAFERIGQVSACFMQA